MHYGKVVLKFMIVTFRVVPRVYWPKTPYRHIIIIMLKLQCVYPIHDIILCNILYCGNCGFVIWVCKKNVLFSLVSGSKFLCSEVIAPVKSEVDDICLYIINFEDLTSPPSPVEQPDPASRLSNCNDYKRSSVIRYDVCTFVCVYNMCVLARFK